MVCGPTPLRVRLQEAAGRVMVQVAIPDLTVIVPVGAVGVLPKAPVTAALTVTAWPGADGSGVCVPTAAVVPALLTVRVRTLALAPLPGSLSTLAEITALPAPPAV